MDAGLRRQRLALLVYVRAFETAAAATWTRRGGPDALGHAFPPAALFAGPRSPRDGDDVEAVIFGTERGALHRLLPHLAPSIHTLEPAASRPGWADWYERVRHRRLRPPPAVSSPDPPPITMSRTAL